MELSRRGILAGLGVAGGVASVGFVGAATVADGGALDDGTEDDSDGDDGGSGTADSDTASVPVDPDAPFEARLVPTDGNGTDDATDDTDGTDDTDDAPFLFDASDLDRVQAAGDGDDSDEHLVYVSLSDDGRADFRDRLADAGATAEPERFAVSMTLGDEEVRRVDLDAPTVAALTDEEWGGVLELPFGTEPVAQDVYESLAADDADPEAEESG